MAEGGPKPLLCNLMEKLSTAEQPSDTNNTMSNTDNNTDNTDNNTDNNTDDYDDSAPDFSLLPDVVWVRVLKLLGLGDRARVSRTCHALWDVFNHPSLWYSAEIILLGAMDKYTHSQVLFPMKYQKMVEHFGHYFQDLTLTITWFFTRFPKECVAVLDALSSNCRLHTLRLSCGTVRTKTDVTTGTTRTADLELLTNIVGRAFRMNTFILKAWPVYENLKSVNIMDVLCNNEKIDELETLSLFWKSSQEATWATLNANLPSPDTILKTVYHFRHLKSLCVQSTMLNDAVVKELAGAKRKPLERLGILLTYNRQSPNGGVPEIKSSTWTQLKAKCPKIQVDVTVVTRMPYDDLHGFLKPELPLASISFMKYSRCTREDLSSIADKYSTTLCEFVNYSDSEDVSDHLVGLVTRSPNIKKFLFNGFIHVDIVLHLARRRGFAWELFQVNFDNISTQNRDVDFDEDAVIARGDDGSVNIVQRMESADESLKAELKEKLVKEVSKALGRKWNPLNRKIIEAAHDETDVGIVPQAVADRILAQE